jgi:hypothetical protein
MKTIVTRVYSSDLRGVLQHESVRACCASVKHSKKIYSDSLQFKDYFPSNSSPSFLDLYSVAHALVL